MFDHETLKDVLSYDRETGYFYRRKSFSNNCKVGEKAGSHDGQGYIRIKVFGKKYKAHRLAWLYCYGYWPESIDHINRDRSDNRIVNLREADKTINGSNRTISCNNSTGKTGVSKRCDGGWRSYIKVNGHQYDLGSYKRYDDAVKARHKAEEEYGFLS